MSYLIAVGPRRSSFTNSTQCCIIMEHLYKFHYNSLQTGKVTLLHIDTRTATIVDLQCLCIFLYSLDDHNYVCVFLVALLGELEYSLST